MANAVNVENLNRYSVQSRIIKLLAGEVCESTADVEAAISIDDEQQAFLAKAYAKGSVRLFIMASEKTIANPSPSFVVEGIYGKVKGAGTASKVADLDAFTVNANGVYGVQQFTVSLGSYTTLNLFTSGGAWAGGDSIKIDAWLLCEVVRND
jgi:hypothetical protein